MKHWTFQEFLRIAKEKHGEKYDYNESLFATIASKIKIICPVHGKFIQSAHDHARGHGCKQCFYESKLTWLESDDFFLRENFPTKGSAWCAKHLERTSLAVNQRCNKLGIKKNHKRQKYIEGNISHTFWMSVVTRAKDKDFELNISKEYLMEIYIEQNKKCALTGWDIKFGCDNTDTTASVDRIDSNRGYIIGNIQIVHKTVNRCKSWYSDGDFYKICSAVYLYRQNDLKESEIIWINDIYLDREFPVRIDKNTLLSQSQTKKSYLLDKKF